MRVIARTLWRSGIELWRVICLVEVPTYREEGTKIATRARQCHLTYCKKKKTAAISQSFFSRFVTETNKKITWDNAGALFGSGSCPIVYTTLLELALSVVLSGKWLN